MTTPTISLRNLFQVLHNFKTQFARNYRVRIINFCRNLPPIIYNGFVKYPSCPGIYEYQLSKGLLDISMAVSQSNCINIYPIPNPPGFTQQYRLTANDPYDGARRMFATIFTDENGEKAIFAFTGTIFLDEWINDLTYQQVEANELNGYQPGIQVHKGFYEIYLAIRDQLWNFYQHNQHTLKELYITGHSLGGALSTICAFDFSQTNPVHYSFAAPRSGNVAYAQRFNQILPTSLRIANTEDVIPNLPLPILGKYIYEHTATLITFTVNLGTIGQNHINAYLDNLPICVPNSAPCHNSIF